MSLIHDADNPDYCKHCGVHWDRCTWHDRYKPTEPPDTLPGLTPAPIVIVSGQGDPTVIYTSGTLVKIVDIAGMACVWKAKKDAKLWEIGAWDLIDVEVDSPDVF